MHLNLHKTFSTPHGGGGPGAGPVVVAEELIPFLPTPVIFEKADGNLMLDYECPMSIGKVAGFYGNFAVLVRALAYILRLGKDGIKAAAQSAVLNAYYLRHHLKEHFHLEYDQPTLHEVVFNDEFQKESGVSTMDIAKRLLDYGFHPPTVYFPLIVQGAMMIEPTETEPKEELDAFIETMKRIAEEARNEPDVVRIAPRNIPFTRFDETLAARKPVLTWIPPDKK